MTRLKKQNEPIREKAKALRVTQSRVNNTKRTERPQKTTKMFDPYFHDLEKQHQNI